MGRSKLPIALIFSIFLFGNVMAASQLELSDIGAVKQNSCFQLQQLCSNCSYVNVTSIAYPDGSVDFVNVGLAQQGVANFNSTSCSTSQLGVTYYDTLGDVDGFAQTKRVKYDVTADGKPAQSFPTQFYLAVLGLVLIFYGQKGFGGKRTSVICTFAGAAFMIFFGVLTLIGYSHINWQTTFGFVVGIVSLGLGFYYMLIEYAESD